MRYSKSLQYDVEVALIPICQEIKEYAKSIGLSEDIREQMLRREEEG